MQYSILEAITNHFDETPLKKFHGKLGEYYYVSKISLIFRKKQKKFSWFFS